MYKKVQSSKQTFGLQKTAEKAKKLVTVGGLSEASAEGTALCTTLYLSTAYIHIHMFAYYVHTYARSYLFNAHSFSTVLQ